ncbi:glycosyltransferase family 39 protein [Patescibacteria group bacterium]|nr:glycosyltransferase family 39 protein [Patescibacteria group bacterium]MBU1911636.1 glycosyltransferase family 39 protein [Patescibacteria group bacterium]
MKILRVASHWSLVTGRETSDKRLATSDTFLSLLILLGILLRFTDLPVPELSTDEAQLALGKSAAWTPLAMQTIVFIQNIFGFETIVARGVSVVMGIITLPIIYLITEHLTNKKTALLATAIAAIFPSHILFSRLAYPSIYLCTAWLLTLLCFLKAKSSKNNLWLIALFLSAVTATFLKSQGLVFPLLLLFGEFISQIRQKRITNYSLFIIHYSFPVSTIILLSLMPVTFYILTHPGILATVLLYGGNMYGVSGAFQRLMELINAWQHTLSLFAIFAIISIGWWKRISWPIWMFLLTAFLTGYLLGPSHEYYSTHLVILSIPIALMFTRAKPIIKNLSLAILTVATIAFLGPSKFSPYVHPLYQQESYWTANADKINEVLKNDEEVMIMGYPGHHLRWYVKPKLLLGRYMNEEEWDGKILILKKDKLEVPEGSEVVYEDDTLVIY